MSVSFLKHYYNFSISFNVILRLISGTSKVGSIVIFNLLSLSHNAEESLKITEAGNFQNLIRSSLSTDTSLEKFSRISISSFYKEYRNLERTGNNSYKHNFIQTISIKHNWQIHSNGNQQQSSPIITCNAAVIGSLTPWVLYDTVSVDPGTNIHNTAWNNLTINCFTAVRVHVTDKEHWPYEKHSQVMLNQIKQNS